MTFQEALITLIRTSPLVPDQDRESLIGKIATGTLPEDDQKSIATLLATFARTEAKERPAQDAAMTQFLNSLQK